MKFSIKPQKKKLKSPRPSYVTMGPRTDNSSILAQAKKRQKKQVFGNTHKIFSNKFDFSSLKKIIILVLIGLFISGITLFLKNTTIFNVKDVVVITDNSKNYDQLLNLVEGYKGSSILFVSSSEIESKAQELVPAIHTTYVNKTLSGVLTVEFIEDVPVYYEANNTGIYLINQSGEVMEVVPPEYTLTFDETETLLKNDKLPYDSDQVRIKYLSTFPEEERDSIIWKDVPKEEKEAVLNSMKDELNQKVSDSINKLSEQLSKDEFKNLIGSYIPNNQSYKVGDELSLENLNFVSIVLDFVKSKNFVVTKVVWDSDYTLEIVLQDNPIILFTVKRTYTSQFSDLNTLIYHGQFNGAKLVDVRSSNYSVVR